MASQPIRTCVGCRRRRRQGELIRVARARDATVAVGPAGPGRSAYVCFDADCVRRALRSGALLRALRCGAALPEGLAGELLARAGAAPGRDTGSEKGRDG
jgi:predicted RNA-binding protein YlxR (DUF448 family)